MWTKISYVVVVLYVITLALFTLAYWQGVNVFWLAAPVTLICGGYMGAIWHLKKRNKI